MATNIQLIRENATLANLTTNGSTDELQTYQCGIATDEDSYVWRSDDGFHIALDSGSTSLTAGSIPFSSDGNHLGEDNSNLFWDSTFTRLGIGTNNPAYDLDVPGTSGVGIGGTLYFYNGSDKTAVFNTAEDFAITQTVGTATRDVFYYDQDEDVVCIGNQGDTTTGAKLSAVGPISSWNGSSQYLSIDAQSSSTATITGVGHSSAFIITSATDLWMRCDGGSTGKIWLDGTSGYLGVNDTAPDNMLHVNGGTDDIVAKFESTDTTCGIELTDGTYTSYIINDSSLGNITQIGPSSTKSSTNITISENGNVGIGTSSTSQRFNVLAPTSPVVGLFLSSYSTVSGSAYFSCGNGSTYGYCGLYDSLYTIGMGSPITQQAKNININSTGNVMIGTTTPVGFFTMNTGTNDIVAHLKSTDDLAYIQLSDEDTDSYIVSQNSITSIGQNNSAHADNLNIFDDGDVKIGTIGTAGGKLVVYQDSGSIMSAFECADTSGYIRIQNGGGTSYIVGSGTTLSIGNDSTLTSNNINIWNNGKVSIHSSTDPNLLTNIDFNVGGSTSISSQYSMLAEFATTAASGGGHIYVREEYQYCYIHSGYGLSGSNTSAQIGKSGSISTSNLSITSDGYLGINKLDPETSLHIDGVVTMEEISSTPSNPADGTQIRKYFKDSKEVWMYNDGGTIRYKYFDMVGTANGWVATTTAP